MQSIGLEVEGPAKRIKRTVGDLTFNLDAAYDLERVVVEIEAGGAAIYKDLLKAHLLFFEVDYLVLAVMQKYRLRGGMWFGVTTGKTTP